MLKQILVGATLIMVCAAGLATAQVQRTTLVELFTNAN